jgi:PAS domain-containing protein
VPRAGDEPPAWYDVTWNDLGDGPEARKMHFATPVDAAVRAESTMRDVVQTLAKTFAHLPIGLAIFDRNRRLALFNPALTDLSGLPAGFLGDRPTLAAFLDELRNRQVMAEPKDYKGWRQMITHLEAEASRGTFAETWSLPDGRTFRVTGRPHPEGAIAFLFEDITDEIALTRRFRKDLQLGQAILDEMPIALAVFSRSGTMTLANAAFVRLWDVDPATTLGEVSVVDCVRRWIEAGQPSPAWGEVRDFVTSIGDRSAWTADVVRADGIRFEMRCTPLPAGDTLVAFAEIPGQPARVGPEVGVTRILRA